MKSATMINIDQENNEVVDMLFRLEKLATAVTRAGNAARPLVKVATVAATFFVTTLHGVVSAAVVPVTTATSVDSVLGAGSSAATGVQVTPLASGTMSANLYSQSFKNASGNEWAYLYQIDNVGGALSLVEQMTLGNFYGGTGAGTTVGYLTAGEPTGFLSTGTPQAPQGNAIVDENLGPLVSIYFSILSGSQITSGEHSNVMFITSDYGPGEVGVNVIDGSVASGLAIGPVPEPGSIVILGFGAFVLLARRWRRAEA